MKIHQFFCIDCEKLSCILLEKVVRHQDFEKCKSIISSDYRYIFITDIPDTNGTAGFGSIKLDRIDLFKRECLRLSQFQLLASQIAFNQAISCL